MRKVYNDACPQCQYRKRRLRTNQQKWYLANMDHCRRRDKLARQRRKEAALAEAAIELRNKQMPAVQARDLRDLL